MDLADFRHLKTLDLSKTSVTGDMRKIGQHDFPTLELLILPSSVYGGVGHQLQLVSEAYDFIMEIYSIKKQHPSLSLFFGWHALLSEDSPDSYGVWEIQGDDIPDLPHFLVFVKAGSRVGYRWQSYVVGYDCYGMGGTFRRYDCSTCEVKWLDPEHNPPTKADFDWLLERAGYRLHSFKWGRETKCG